MKDRFDMDGNKISKYPYARLLDSAPKPKPDAIALTLYVAIVILTSALIGMLTWPS